MRLVRGLLVIMGWLTIFCIFFYLTFPLIITIGTVFLEPGWVQSPLMVVSTLIVFIGCVFPIGLGMSFLIIPLFTATIEVFDRD